MVRQPLVRGIGGRKAACGKWSYAGHTGGRGGNGWPDDSGVVESIRSTIFCMKSEYADDC